MRSREITGTDSLICFRKMRIRNGSQREMNPMLENEAMLSKMLAFVKKLFAEQQAEMKVTDKKSYQVIEVDPEIKKWSGCTSFSADEIESDQRLKAILSR